jgi:hypothetical protein
MISICGMPKPNMINLALRDSHLTGQQDEVKRNIV